MPSTWAASDLVILVPTLGRPHHLRPLLESIREATQGARVLFLTSPADEECRRALDGLGQERLDVRHHPSGDYARKINIGYRTTREPLIFTGATDLCFHPGWFEAATTHLRPGIGVVGINDLGNPRVTSGGHATHLLVTRCYADRLGVVDQPRAILHEGYAHECCDDEAVETAKARGAWTMALDAHVEHLHPAWGKGVDDRMYACAPARIRAGQRLLRARRRLWTR